MKVGHSSKQRTTFQILFPCGRANMCMTTISRESARNASRGSCLHLIITFFVHRIGTFWPLDNNCWPEASSRARVSIRRTTFSVLDYLFTTGSGVDVAYGLSAMHGHISVRFHVLPGLVLGCHKPDMSKFSLACLQSPLPFTLRSNPGSWTESERFDASISIFTVLLAVANTIRSCDPISWGNISFLRSSS